MDPLSPLDAGWTPEPNFIFTTNIASFMEQAGCDTYEELHAWSVRDREAYWDAVIERLGIRFATKSERVADLTGGVEAVRWLPGSRLNIVESCFQAPPDSIAIMQQSEEGRMHQVTVAELAASVQTIASNLRRCGFQVGDAIAIMMPMTVECVSIYLGIISAGCVAVSIADSFSPKEVSVRLRISKAKAIFTAERMTRGGKSHSPYARVQEADAPRAIVVPETFRGRMEQHGSSKYLASRLPLPYPCREVPWREGDLSWEEFLRGKADGITVSCAPDAPMNILFSSGTTGDPKAIPWTQTTPLKCAADAHFHQDVRPGDVLVWPTNIGWMMGPWLIFASLLNRAAMGLYDGTPMCPEFGRFVQESGATMLGVVPSLVKAWRATGCMDGCDWTGLKLFSSTGECSNVDDMRWLMARAGGRPVVEYCGGTEIGGAYITSTITRPCRPGLFNTPTLGLDVVILDEEGAPAERGELFLVPPSIGLSNTLLNQDHHAVYFAGTPRGPHGEILRRHGDQMEALPGGYWRGQGRADDTMNLGGIKVSSAEIERVLQAVPGVVETAAIAVSADGGPSALVVYAVCSAGDRPTLLAAMQGAIRRELNPLFKIHDLVLIDTLPRTASNKVMRRVLRDRYAAAK